MTLKGFSISQEHGMRELRSWLVSVTVKSLPIMGNLLLSFDPTLRVGCQRSFTVLGEDEETARFMVEHHYRMMGVGVEIHDATTQGIRE